MSEMSECIQSAPHLQRSAASIQLGNAGREVPTYAIARWYGRSRKHCVIIPVINEGKRIGRLLARMADLGIAERADIIIVDGGSTDDSLATAILDSASVRGLLVKMGPGKLSAQLRCAYAFALEQGYAGIITIDGNDKDDPQSLPTFIEALEQGYDFVQASRFIEGAIEERTPWKRRVAIRWMHAPLISFASGFDWTDTTQGYRGYSRRLLENPEVAPFRQCFKDYELLAYLSCRAPQLGFRCIEVPTARRYPRGEAIPTKIGSLRGELAVFKTLLTACIGRFDPEPSSVNPRFIAWGAVAVAMFIAIALRVTAWALHRDLWIDEAMLYAAIEHQPVLLPWHALTLFEQSCPYFLALLWRALMTLTGPDELVLRLPSLFASVSALFALGTMARRCGLGPVGTGTALAIAGLSEVAIVQAAQLKQYSFELLATTLILLAAERALRRIRAGQVPWSFPIISIGLLPISYAAPVVTAACAVALLLAAKLPDDRYDASPLVGQRRATPSWRLILLAAPWAVSVLLWHHYVVIPSTHFQFSAYPYAQYYLALTDVETWRFLGVILAPLKPRLGSAWLSDVAMIVIAISWILGLVIGWRRNIFLHAIALAFLGICVALSLLHWLPLVASRHFLFALPVLALSIGAAIQALSTEWLARSRLSAKWVAGYASVLLLIFASSFLATAEVPVEDVRKVLTSQAGRSCQTIWTYYAAWPAVLVYRTVSDATFIGGVATQSVANGWVRPIRENFSEYVRVTRELLGEQSGVCLLFSHARAREQMQLITAASASHVCHATHEGAGVSLYACRRRPPAPRVDP